MVERIANRLANGIVSYNGKIDDKGIYYYGLQIVVNTLCSLTAVLLAGIILNEVTNTIIFLISYCAIRIFAGGFHASTNAKCMGIFIGGYFVVKVILNHIVISLNMWTASIMVLVNILIVLWAPIEALNNPIPANKKKKLKRRSFFISIIITSIIFVMLYYKLELGAWGYAGICWFSIVFLAGKIKNNILLRRNSYE